MKSLFIILEAIVYTALFHVSCGLFLCLCVFFPSVSLLSVHLQLSGLPELTAKKNIQDGNSDGTDHCLSGCFLRRQCERLYLSSAGMCLCLILEGLGPP